MAVSREYGKVENDPGDWIDYVEDKDLGKTVELCVRRIPAAVERDLKVRFDQMTMRVKNAGTVIDLEKARKHARARAAFALKDTRNFEHLVGDDDAARVYTTLLGKPVKAGDAVRLDAQWSDAVKDHYLEEHSELANFILSWVDKDRLKVQERQEALEANL